MTNETDTQIWIDRYILSSRTVVADPSAAERNKYVKTAMNYLHKMMSINSNEVSRLEIYEAATLEMESVFIRFDGAQAVLFDQFLSLQLTFINKLYFKPISKDALIAFLCQVAGGVALKKGFCEQYVRLYFIGLSSSDLQNYITSTRDHLRMDHVQRMLVCAHEYVHFLIRHKREISDDFDHFFTSWIIESNLKSFYDQFFSKSDLNFEEFLQIASDKQFVEELFCDFRAMNYIHLFLCRQKDVFGSVKFSWSDYFLASMSLSVNLKIVKALQYSLDIAISPNRRVDKFGNDLESTKASYQFDIRRLYIFQQLVFLGKHGHGDASSLELWLNEVIQVGKVVDSVAQNVIVPATSFVANIVIPSIFSDLSLDSEFNFAAGSGFDALLARDRAMIKFPLPIYLAVEKVRGS